MKALLRVRKFWKGHVDVSRILALVWWFAITIGPFSVSAAQTPPEDHLAHHPDQATDTSISESPSSPEMMETMQDMMREMLVPPPKELYPALMDLSQLTAERRAILQTAAQERMQIGMAMLSDGLDRLGHAISANNYTSMQEATTLMREAIDRFNSGLATQQGLANDLPPRDIGIQWFRQEMKLPMETTPVANYDGVLGVSWYHFGIMVILIGFAIAMIWNYVHRANAASLILQSLIRAPTTEKAALVQTRTTDSESPGTHNEQSASIQFPKKWNGQMLVTRILQETPDVKTFRLMNPLGGVLPFTYLPGQYITVSVIIGGSLVKRSYTIASSPTQRDYIELTVKHSKGGQVSGHLHSTIQEGDLLGLSGPAGTFVFTGRECKCILLIAGGVGITPLMSVLRYLLDRSWSGEIFLIYGCRSPEDIIFREELEYLRQRNKNLRVVITILQGGEKGWVGPTGNITKQLIMESVPDLAERYVHICGPVPMMEAVKRSLAELGVPTTRIVTEAFGPAMGKVERISPPTVGATERVNSSFAEQEITPTVTFHDSGKTALLPAGKVVLDIAEELGIDIDYSCRAGTCGVCRIKLLSGNVTMAVEDGLQSGDKENNIILACQAVARNNIVVQV